MLRNYVKIAFRNIFKQKGFSFINIAGLAVGIACCILIAQFVIHEFSYDTMHPESDRTFRVIREITAGSGEPRTNVALDYQMADRLAENFPEVETVTRFSAQTGDLAFGETVLKDVEFYLSDPSFFELFHVEFLAGDPNSALDRPFTAVITLDMARQLFGSRNPMDMTFEYEGRGPFTVTGVVRDLPGNTHLGFDLLASLESARSWLPSDAYTELGYNWIYTYLSLPEGYDPVEMEDKIASLMEESFPQESGAFRVTHMLQPVEDIHLYSHYSGELKPGGNATVVFALIGLAILILLIACFNYVNLATARAIRRAKEVGMRKALGANRRDVRFQFLGESMLMVALAFGFAFLLVELSLPLFTRAGIHMPPDLFYSSPEFLAGSLSLFLVVAFLAGAWPALLISRYEPMEILAGRGGGADSGDRSYFRRGMVTLQFAISIFLIAATLVIYSQVQYVRGMNLGFEKEQLLVLDLSDSEMRPHLESLKQEIGGLGGVAGVSAASDVPPAGLNSWRILPEGSSRDEVDLMKVMAVDEHFLQVMGMEITEGRGFNENLASDRQNAIILNESAVRVLGLDSPVGQRFDLMNNLKQGEVIGVVEDFHITSLHQEIEPVFLHIWPDWYGNLVIRVQSETVAGTLQQIEGLWNDRVRLPFEYAFVDEDFEALYRQEERMASILSAGAAIAIFITCLGLLGLIAYKVERRTREIGIRKVLGASAAHILGLLSREFLVLLAAGFVVAAPLVWILMNRWLQDFAYRTTIGFDVFLMAGAAALLVTLASVGFQSMKASLLNPVESLRSD